MITLSRSRMWIALLVTTLLLAACTADTTPTTAPATADSAPEPASEQSTAAPPEQDTPAVAPTLQDATPAATGDAPQPTAAPATDLPTELPAADPGALALALETVAQGLRQPVAVTHAGDGSGRLFVLEKDGRVRIIADGQLQQQPFLDITDRVGAEASEQGLLGIAFPPDFSQSGLFFLYYTDTAGNTVVSRFSVTLDADAADPASEAVVLTQVQPAGNHNGGQLAFGPDGYLYIGLGDGGAAGDRFGNGQNIGTWLGTLLRIDVAELPYSVPADNPFVDDPAGLDEIWAYGLRNPWRFSFDRATNDLYIADVGQNAYEEVNVQPASSSGGENYGWPIMEGAHCYNTPNCDPAGLVLPFAEYSHEGGHCSVTGGYVYRGETYPAMQGVYFYADYCSGQIWGAAPSAEGWQAVPLLQADFNPASFGEDEAGELYVADIGQGVIYRIAAR